MKKFFTLAGLSMALFTATGAQPSVSQLQPNLLSLSESFAEAQLPAALRNFLKTPEGSRYSATQMMSAIRHNKAPQKAAGAYIATTVLSEDFSKWTAGEVGNPDATVVEDNSLMQQPGDWTLFLCQQAGGTCYEGFDEVGDDGPGYVKTFGVDVTQGEKLFRVSCRAMNANAAAQDQLLQGMFLDEKASTIHSASAVALKYNEWTDCEWFLSNGSDSISVMLLGWQGKVYIDDIKIEQITFPLTMAQNINVVRTDADKLSVSWDKVEGATSYKIECHDAFHNVVFGSAEVGDVNTVELTIDQLGADAEESAVVSVTAYDGDKCSYPSTWSGEILAETCGDGVALEATEVDENGFTANWNKAVNAISYLVTTTHSHTAVADGEEFEIFNETFANLPESYDAYNPATIVPMLGMGNLDLLLNRSGWSTDCLMMFYMAPEMPCLVLTNIYNSYGILGKLCSPKTDFSVGGGKVTVSGSGFSSAGDVVVYVGFANALGVLQDGYKEVEFAAGTPSEFSVELEGGAPNSSIVMYIGDSTEEEDMVGLLSLTMKTTLNAGETIAMPHETKTVRFPATSVHFDDPVNANHTYTYAVTPFVNESVIGAKSEDITVSSDITAVNTINASKVSVKAFGGKILVDNPEGADVRVFTVDGRMIGSSNATNASFNVEKSIYIVKAGNQVFKLSAK